MKTYSVAIAIVVSIFILVYGYLKINRYEYVVNVPEVGISQITVIDKLSDRARVSLVEYGKWEKIK